MATVTYNVTALKATVTNFRTGLKEKLIALKPASAHTVAANSVLHIGDLLIDTGSGTVDNKFQVSGDSMTSAQAATAAEKALREAAGRSSLYLIAQSDITVGIGQDAFGDSLAHGNYAAYNDNVVTAANTVKDFAVFVITPEYYEELKITRTIAAAV